MVAFSGNSRVVPFVAALTILVALFCLVPSGWTAPAPTKSRNRTGSESGASPIQESLKEFARKNKGKKADEQISRLIEQLSAQVAEFKAGGEQEDPRLRAVRRLAAELDANSKARKSRFKQQKVSQVKRPSGPRSFPLPKELMYRFGVRELQVISDENRLIKTQLRKGVAPGVSDLTTELRLEALLNGCVPETELAIAEIERRLDVLEEGDRFAEFLESWRNYGPYGDESFYEALDRTAGTPEEVFFYDAMLAAFVGGFAGESGKRWSLDKQHDHNQRAFLSYRQYRGLIEAAAYSLVLPPDVALPARLSRYDYSSVTKGKFSLRHQLDLLVFVSDGDAVAVVELLREFLKAHPLPEHLWDPYDPISPLQTVFNETVQRRIVSSGRSMQEVWETSAQRNRGLAERIREAVLRLLEE